MLVDSLSLPFFFGEPKCLVKCCSRIALIMQIYWQAMLFINSLVLAIKSNVMCQQDTRKWARYEALISLRDLSAIVAQDRKWIWRSSAKNTRSKAVRRKLYLNVYCYVSSLPMSSPTTHTYIHTYLLHSSSRIALVEMETIPFHYEMLSRT